MTHAELYDIVKDHRDVWGKHFHTVRRGDESTIFVRHYANAEGEPAHREMELLGLGVAWLAKNGGSANIYPPMSGSPDYFVSSDMSACSGRPSILAAVYAAIAEVKRG